MNETPPNNLSNEGRPIGTISWVTSAWRVMSRNLPVWLLAGSVMLIAIILSTNLKMVGQLVLSLLTPVFIGALVRNCSDTDSGLPVSAKTIFSAFNDQDMVKRLLLLSCFLFMLLVLVIVVAIALYLAFSSEEVVRELREHARNQQSGDPSNILVENLESLIGVVFGVFCLYFLASFFSIPHVALRKSDPISAIKVSMVYSFRHIFSIIGVCVTVFAISVVASFLLINPLLALIFLVVVVWPFTVCIQYAAYMSIFGNPNTPSSDFEDKSNDTILKA